MVKYVNHNYTEREKTVIDVLLKHYELDINSFLNVGFHSWNDKRTHWWIKFCEFNKIDWKILEIFEPNIISAIKDGCPVNKIQLGDILNYDSYDNYDCILFWHGPEHIKKDIFLENLNEIEKKANKIIIFGAPLGHEPQGIVYGNSHEEHISEWISNDFIDLGYQVIEVHDGLRYSHITAYKIL